MSLKSGIACLYACLLVLPAAAPAQARSSCFQRLGAIGLICRHYEPELAIEVRGLAPGEEGRLLLRVTQTRVAAAGRGSLVQATADGRVALYLQADGNVRVSMGPTDEGKVHHVLFEQHLGGAVIATYDSIAEAPDIPADPVAPEGDGSGGASSGPSHSARRVARQPAREDGSIIHVVRPGQTLLAIALAYGVGLQELVAHNDLSGSLLPVGVELLIPAAPEEEEAEQPGRCAFYGPVVYVVRPGDSLYRIAQAFDVKRELLTIRNQLADRGNLLHPGQELVIPGVTRPETRGREVPAECVDDSPILHVVQAGQTLDLIAHAYDIEPETLMERNGLPPGGRRLRVGQTLVIREAKAAEAADDETPTDN
ncbi:MAG: LysM peptidoglycan-binding domain-containing protein [Anaerolineaceae bacterium]|nr:LysM peptidoglycan-binding domain-containing protein [Anaerolineaceae bacterium]